VVVTDLAMPNLDGVELCRTVRKMSQVPIIGALGPRTGSLQSGGSGCGADDYVTKPFQHE